MMKLKKLASMVLALVLCLTLCVPAMAKEDAPPIYNIDRNADPIAYQNAQAQYIEDHHDEIQAEIDAYQASTPSTYAYNYGGFTYLTGDILVTSSTVASEIFGHAGMVVESTSGGCQVLDISPKNSGDHPATFNIQTWFANYPSVYVLRTGISDAMAAASYGKSYYVNGAGSGITYNLISGLYGTGNTYCSALVWRCFHAGSGVEFKVISEGPTGLWIVPAFYLPYDFITFRSINNLTAVHSVNW